MATQRHEVPDDVLAELREVCLALPEAYEEPAWTGTRWSVRRKVFAHVVALADGWPPVYSREAGTDGPALVVTFRAAGDDLDALTMAGPPFFRPPWAPNVIGLVLAPEFDRDELAELLTDSYCVVAPERLAARVTRPEPP
jgi:predicted DNA-binding protein (MmcQ/YjbR family)